MSLRTPSHISAIKPYVPGKPIEELEREYGIRDSIKLASNENPLGPSPLAVKAIVTSLETLHRYPDGAAHNLIRKLSEHLNIPRDRIVLGNGSDDIIGMLGRVFLEPGDEALIPTPSFLMYDIVVRCTGATPVYVPLKSLGIDLEGVRKAVTPKTRMIFICNPNNPTGTIITRQAFERFAGDLPEGVIIVVDEAYIEFARNPDCLKSTGYEGRHMITLRTFSKAYGLAGLRVGYAVTSPEIGNLLNRVRMPFNTSIPAQAGACAALDDRDFFKQTLRTVHEGLDFLYAELSKIGIRYFPTQANFFLIDLQRNADEIFQALLRQGVIVRSMTSYGFPEYIRINAGTMAENQRFIRALNQVLA